MRLGIDDILSAHGIGGQPGPYFGNGSDGAFNPVPPATVSVNANIAFGINGGYYTGSSATSQPTTLTTSSTVPCLGLVCDEGTTNNGQTSSQYDVKPGYTATNTTYNSTQTGVMFSSSQAININGVWVATGGLSSNYSIQIKLWDTTTTTLVTQSAVISTGLSAGWNQINLPSSVSLVAGRNYMIGIVITGASNVFNGYYYNPVTPTVNAQYTYTSQGTYTFNTTQDGPALVKQFTSVNIPANLTVTVSNRCQGMIWLVDGDVNINGVITMDYMGAMLDPTQNTGFVVATKAQQLYYPIGNNKFVVVGPGGIGGAGGGGGNASANKQTAGGLPTSGTWWGGGNGGGGGGGNGGGGAGGNASYTGASAGGSSVTGSGTQSGVAGTNGGGGSGAAYYSTSGQGGKGLGGGGGGGGGSNWSGSSTVTFTASPGSDSTQAPGGLILIIAKGNITINSGAVLSAKGGVGGNGGNGPNYPNPVTNLWGGGGGGGGGAGGGIVALLYRGTYSNSGTINVAGGAGGAGGGGASAQSGTDGYAGLPGLIQTVKLA